MATHIERPSFIDIEPVRIADTCPDFLLRLSSGKMLALEIKGTDSGQNKAKRDALNEWVKSINGTGGFGQWAWGVAFKPSDVKDIISEHANAISRDA